jgi:hypothetical protein
MDGLGKTSISRPSVLGSPKNKLPFFSDRKKIIKTNSFYRKLFINNNSDVGPGHAPVEKK